MIDKSGDSCLISSFLSDSLLLLASYLFDSKEESESNDDSELANIRFT